LWISFVLGAALLRAAGPQDFGMAELNAAVTSHDFKIAPKFMAELDLNAPETFRIEPYQTGGGHITGGDLRGLMYGLLEAATEIRDFGKLKMIHGTPVLMLRSVRIKAEPEADWFASETFWRGFFETMARDRFNRLHIAFDAAPQEQDFATLRMIAETAAQDGVDVAVGLDAPSPKELARLLAKCPAIRTVVLNGVGPVLESGALWDVLHDAGRRVVLEAEDGETSASLTESENRSALPLRRFAVYAGVSVNPLPADFYWRMDATQNASVLDSISGGGFEIAATLGSDGRPTLDGIGSWGLRGYGPR
jgi:hypothetical protein